MRILIYIWFLIVLLPNETEVLSPYNDISQSFIGHRWDLFESDTCRPDDQVVDLSPHDDEDSPMDEWTGDMDPDEWYD